MSQMLATSHFRKGLVLAFFFAVAFLSYIWANQFPYFYHSDEESKVLQLLYGYRNYWHPMLMLNVTKTIGWLTGLGGDSQSLTMIGRYSSALFSALGVVFFMEMAWRRKGAFVAIFTGVLLLTLPLLFEVSHYSKEDPALFMGLGLTLLALELFLKKNDTSRVLFLGFAAGLATSAKYPGALLIAGLIPVVALRNRRFFAVLYFLLAALLTVLAINWQWLTHLPQLGTGIARESAMLANGHDGMAGHFPHSQYWCILLYQHGWPILLTALLGLAFSQKKKEVFSTEFVLGFACLLALAVMSYSVKVSDRYLLPIMAITVYLSACGVEMLGRLFEVKYRLVFSALVCGIILWYPVSMMTHWVNDFRKDSRAEMSHWLLSHRTNDEKIATSLWTRLPGLYEGQFITGVAPADYVADLGTVQQLREMGYRWVAVADVESRRFDSPLQSGRALAQEHFLRRRFFYKELLANSDLRWSAPSSYVYHLHPGLKIYELRR